MENRQYMIFNVSEAASIDFNEVLQTSAETLRKSNDNSKSFVKWEGRMITISEPNVPTLDENGHPVESETLVELVTELYIPESVKALTTKEGPYTNSEIKAILSNSEWSQDMPI